MGDPLYADGIDAAVLLIVAAKVLIVFAFLMVSVLFMVWFERKVISDMQSRIGPNRAGPWGLLQTLADGIKLFFKEDLLPEQADRRVFRLAPYLSIVPAFAAFAVVPFGGTISVFGHRTHMQLADPPVGVLFLLAMSGIAVYGVMLAGWASGSKYPLLGSVRASAQMVSYEAAMSLAIAAAVLTAGSLSTRDIVIAQEGYRWNLWVLGVVPFVVYLIAATAETNRPPFDLVEAEQELVGGFHTEYASISFALFFLAEFMNTVTVSAVAVTLFLGGPNGPRIGFLPDLWPVVWFLGKLLIFLFVYVWFRATLPRFRYDQLMDLGWKKLIPLALYWLLLIAALRVGRDRGWEWYYVLGAGVAVGAVAWGALSAALRQGDTVKVAA
ncbi:MAG: NADH-ubiquinone oxidoreductase chain H [uncultured Acidimicrobiales bacterium]|uniref:NADH-quinone oxidoreductase subunit H n=1 Tax=uncultured Acidimicrobiales bacterium TaxID=310071 RepID=A0A6J4JGV8_9ACTN|nr:MAG: NADH-ubiquinone oxidoreductase chain H [uncultured Acidimicrobiales bacterium]